MKRDIDDYRKRLLIIVSCLFIGIISMTLVYAALATTLNITGRADVTASSFRVEISRASDEEMREFVDGDDLVKIDGNFAFYGDAKVIHRGEISSSGVKNIDLSVVKPGDAVGGVFKITNTGSLPVIYTGVNLFELNYSSLSNNSSDIEWARNNVSLGYDVSDKEDTLEENEVICPGESFYVLLFLEVNSDASTLPSDGLELTNFGMDLSFGQADSNSCNN